MKTSAWHSHDYESEDHMAGRPGRAARVMRMGAALAAAALTFAVGTGPIGGAEAETSLPWWCAPGATLDASVLPSHLPAVAGCDLTGRVVHSGTGVGGVTIPEPGIGVSYDSVGANATSVTVRRLADGAVDIDTVVPASSSEVVVDMVKDTLGLSENPDPCAASMASAYAKDDYKVYGTLTWLYNPLNEPTAVAGTALAAVDAGATAMADGHNDCGITTVPRTSFHAYAGPTTKAPAVTTVCGATDGTSAVGWGGGLGGALAATCSWRVYDRTPARWVESDIKIATAYRWTTNPSPLALCLGLGINDAYDLQGVMTHEWGHAFGIDHISWAGTQTQTMYPYGRECDATPRSLGRGDVNGMISIYGAL